MDGIPCYKHCTLRLAKLYTESGQGLLTSIYGIHDQYVDDRVRPEVPVMSGEEEIKGSRLKATYRLTPVRLWCKLKISAAVRMVSARTAMPTPAEFIH